MSSDEWERLRQILNGVDPAPEVVDVPGMFRETEGRRVEGGLRLPAKACQKRIRDCLSCGAKYEGYYPGMCVTCKGHAVGSEDEWSLAT